MPISSQRLLDFYITPLLEPEFKDLSRADFSDFHLDQITVGKFYARIFYSLILMVHNLFISADEKPVRIEILDCSVLTQKSLFHTSFTMNTQPNLP